MPLGLLPREGAGLSGGRLNRLALLLGLLCGDLGRLPQRATQGSLFEGGFLCRHSAGLSSRGLKRLSLFLGLLGRDLSGLSQSARETLLLEGFLLSGTLGAETERLSVASFFALTTGDIQLLRGSGVLRGETFLEPFPVLASRATAQHPTTGECGTPLG